MDTELFMECEEEELEPWQQVEDGVEEDEMDYYNNYCEPVEDSRSPLPASETPPPKMPPPLPPPTASPLLQLVSSSLPASLHPPSSSHSPPPLMAPAPPLILTQTAEGKFLLQAASGTHHGSSILLTTQGFPVMNSGAPLLLNQQPGQTMQPLTLIQSPSLGQLVRPSMGVSPVLPQGRAGPAPSRGSAFTTMQLPTLLIIRNSTPRPVNLQITQVGGANPLKLAGPPALPSSSANGVTRFTSFSSGMCRICEWAFENEPAFLNQMKSNHKPGEMPYVCQVCSYRSSFYLDVLQHFGSFHRDSRLLLCLFCLNLTKNPTSYHQHLLKHQINQAFHCNRCRLQFVFLKDKMQHKLENHRSFRCPAQLEELPPGSKSPASLIQPINIKTEKSPVHRSLPLQKSPRSLTKRPVSRRLLDSPSRGCGEAEAGDEEVSTRGHIQDRRGRSCGDAVRDRSRSPHQRWQTEAEPDDGVPQPPRFNPKRTPGVQPPLDMGNPAPGEIFSHFFDATVFKLLCENTNKNAAKNRKRGRKFLWTEITPEEMKKFIGMLLYMSVLDLPKMSDFWRKKTIFHVSFPATVMSRDRFMAILSNLHMSDPEKNEENDQKKGTEDYDHLHRVRPLMEMICINCKAIYHPRQHISVDERMVGTKARLCIKQYMKAKPTKWGLKFFVLADMNGYTIDFKLYTGRSKTASGKGHSFDIVAGLVNKDYLGSGYIIYTDNFYTSPVLFRHLSQQGFGACGTYRKGRIGVPTTQENALTKRSPRGSIRWIRDRDLLFVKWMDTREVSLCSTIHPVYMGDTVQRWQKTGDGPKQKLSVPRPTTVTEYNKYMGGVDTSDQMIGTNSVHRKTRRWPTTVFQHLVDIAATNSFVIHKARCVSLQQQNPMTRQRFQEELTAHLLGVDLKSGPQKTPGKHLPVPTSSRQTKAQRASMGRQRCKLCKRSTAWKCEDCDVGLCLQPDRNCHWQYHQVKRGEITAD